MPKHFRHCTNTITICKLWKGAKNESDFSSVLKVYMEFDDVTSAGKLFHARAAATGNARSSTVDGRGRPDDDRTGIVATDRMQGDRTQLQERDDVGISKTMKVHDARRSAVEQTQVVEIFSTWRGRDAQWSTLAQRGDQQYTR